MVFWLVYGLVCVCVIYQLYLFIRSQNDVVLLSLQAKQTILDMAKERCQLRTIRQHLSQLQLSIMNVAVKDEVSKTYYYICFLDISTSFFFAL